MLIPMVNLIMVRKIISHYNKLLFKILEHGDKIEKKVKEPAEHPEAKDHTPHHGHDNQVCFILIEI